MLNHAINTGNALKYFVMFFVVTTATKIIPTCGVLQEHAIYVGLIAASTFALIVKFNLCLDSPKYPIAVDHLIPFGLFKGKGPTPVLPGALASSQKGCPASRHAF